MSAADNTARAQLLRLGIGDFNATMIVPTMFYGPAQSDPGLTQVKVLLRGMQKAMREMGATWVQASGDFDENTATCLKAVGGPMWTEMPWYELTAKLLAAKDAGKRFERPTPAQGVALHGFGGILDDITSASPQKMAAYIGIGIAAYYGYKHFKKGY